MLLNYSGIWPCVEIESDLTEGEGLRDKVGCVPHPESFYNHTQDHSLKRTGRKTSQMHTYSIKHRRRAPTLKLPNSTVNVHAEEVPPSRSKLPIKESKPLNRSNLEEIY